MIMKNKKLILLISIILAACLFALCFTSCGSGLDKDKAKSDITEFLREIKNGDFEAAESYLHPSFTDEIEPFFTSLEEKLNIDFQSGISILGYHGFYYAAYSSDVDGSAYELDIEIEVSGNQYDITVTVVQNDEGYGIYGFEFNY